MNVKTRSHDLHQKLQPMQAQRVNTKIVHLKSLRQIPMLIRTQKSQHHHYRWMRNQIIRMIVMVLITTTTIIVNNFHLTLWMDQKKFCLHHQLIGRILTFQKWMVSLLIKFIKFLFDHNKSTRKIYKKKRSFRYILNYILWNAFVSFHQILKSFLKSQSQMNESLHPFMIWKNLSLLDLWSKIIANRSNDNDVSLIPNET